MTTAADPTRDRDLARATEFWFAAHARDLPWRTTPRDPFGCLVAEFMLQQTQVARVLERWSAFLERFPTPSALARADERDVLAMWSGLGYYRRARMLHACAKAIVRNHGGLVPSDAETLRALPGVGRYTAGAIASIVFGQREPLVDGNVVRVLLRVENEARTHGSPEAIRWSWPRATHLVDASTRPDLLNEGLMELGATVCTPRSPNCGSCPLNTLCTARSAGTADQIPLPKPATNKKVVHATVVVAFDARGRLLLRQRPPGGMWAGLWQPPTTEREGRAPTPAQVRDALGLACTLKPLGRFGHTTSHREFRFRIVRAEGLDAPSRRALARHDPTGRWIGPAGVDALGISTPVRRAIDLAFALPSRR